jgi:hypothetical protein
LRCQPEWLRALSALLLPRWRRLVLDHQCKLCRMLGSRFEQKFDVKYIRILSNIQSSPVGMLAGVTMRTEMFCGLNCLHFVCRK